MNIRGIFSCALLAATLALAGCHGDEDAGAGWFESRILGDCSTTAGRNQAVYALMNDWYYWYKQIPDVNPADYASPQALLDAIRYRPLDETFTYLTTVSEEEAFLNNAAYFGFGFSMLVSGDRLFLREVFADSPAEAAGLRRGDEILSIDGVDVATLINNDALNDAFGPDEAGHEVTFEVLHPGASQPETLVIAKDEVFATVVGEVVTDLGAGADTTYIYFRSFVNPAFDELDAAFAQMQAAGDTQLVLDMRYNGGGLLSVAEHLAGLIAGETDAGEVVAEVEFNDKHTDRNEQYLIRLLANSVAVTDLVVITTGSTASASEMIINGLEPHMNVATVGDNTYGKPVGQSRLEFCEEDILRAVTFKVVNSEGQGEYFRPTGIPPTCAAEDDIFNAFGDVNEASLAEALHWLEAGSCTPAASVKAAQKLALQKAAWPDGAPLVRDGWDILTGGAR